VFHPKQICGHPRTVSKVWLVSVSSIPSSCGPSACRRIVTTPSSLTGQPMPMKKRIWGLWLGGFARTATSARPLPSSRRGVPGCTLHLLPSVVVHCAGLLQNKHGNGQACPHQERRGLGSQCHVARARAQPQACGVPVICSAANASVGCAGGRAKNKLAAELYRHPAGQQTAKLADSLRPQGGSAYMAQPELISLSRSIDSLIWHVIRPSN